MFIFQVVLTVYQVYKIWKPIYTLVCFPEWHAQNQQRRITSKELRWAEDDLINMAEENKVCVICKEGATPSMRLLSNPDMIEDLLQSCRERVSLGQSDIQQLTNHLSGLNKVELESVYYHSECRKPIVNKTVIERLRGNQSRPDSPVCSRQGPEPPSKRPKRVKAVPKEKVCLFSSCDFCSEDDSEPLHRVLSDAMGETLVQIKQQTQADQVRICVADLFDAGDASALEKYYHRTCLRTAQRTSSTKIHHDNELLIRSLCDEQLILAIQNTLKDKDVTLDMAQVNDAYLSILKRYHMDIDETTNYRKYLKKIISELLPDVQFVGSLRRNEPDKLVRSTVVSKAIDLRLSMMENDQEIGKLKNVANLLRAEIMQKRSWSFTGTFDNFENPSKLQFFLSLLLFGSHNVKVSGVRDEEVDKTVDVACQFLVQITMSQCGTNRTRRTALSFHQLKRMDGI